MTIADLIESLSDPDPLVWPMPVWIWNGSVELEHLKKQLESMHERGVRATIIQALPSEFSQNDFHGEGLSCEYLGQEHMAAIKFIVEAAESLGMYIWFQDEGGWPSGQNLKGVITARPDLAGKVHHYNEEGQVEVPERGYPVELLNPETTATFISQVHERYKEVVGSWFGKTVLGFITDDPRFGGRLGGAEIPHTPALFETFKERKGYDITLALPVLFGLKSGDALPPEKRAQVRIDFMDVVTQLWRESYFIPLKDWCHDNGLLLAGYLDYEETLQGHVSGAGDFFRASAEFDWPGMDAPSRTVHSAAPPTDYPKFASSLSHTRAKARTLSICFAGGGWDLTPEAMKWSVDHQAVRGVNVFAPVGVYSDTTGSRALGICSNLGEPNPIWPYFGSICYYIARLGTLITAGKSVAEVGVYYPVRSLWRNTDGRVDSSLAELSRRLLEYQVDFDYLDDDLLESAEVDKDELVAGGNRYGAMLFPLSTVVSVEAMRTACAFDRAGGIVAFFGEMPTVAARSADNVELAELVSKLKATFVQEISESDLVFASLPWTVKLKIDNPDIRAARWVAGEIDLFLIVNESVEEQHLHLTLPTDRSPHLLSFEDASLTRIEADNKAVRLTLPPLGSVGIVCGDSDLVADSSSESSNDLELTSVPVKGQWTVRLLTQVGWEDGAIVVKGSGSTSAQRFADGPFSGELEVAVLDDLVDWRKIFDDNLSGQVDYSIRFDLEKVDGPIILDLGDVGTIAEVMVNEKFVGERLWRPYRLDISDVVIVGSNVLRVLVTSTMGALISSPQVLDDIKDRGWDNSFFKESQRIVGERSVCGLLGPVTIEQ